MGEERDRAGYEEEEGQTAAEDWIDKPKERTVPLRVVSTKSIGTLLANTPLHIGDIQDMQELVGRKVMFFPPNTDIPPMQVTSVTQRRNGWLIKVEPTNGDAAKTAIWQERKGIVVRPNDTITIIG